MANSSEAVLRAGHDSRQQRESTTSEPRRTPWQSPVPLHSDCAHAQPGPPERSYGISLQDGAKNASQLAKSARGQQQPALARELTEAANAYCRVVDELAVARKDETNAQLRIDRVRWEQARIIARLYGRWGKRGLTFLAISKRFGIKESTVKWYVGIHMEFGGRPDLPSRRFSEWGHVNTGLRSALRQITRLAIDERTQTDFATSVRSELSDVIGLVISNRKNRTSRQLRVATKRAVQSLIAVELEKLYTPSAHDDVSLQRAGGVNTLTEVPDDAVSALFLDLPYASGSNPRDSKMANDNLCDLKRLLREIAPLVPAKLTRNGFAFWFRPGFDLLVTDGLKPILLAYCEMRQLIWSKTHAGLSAEGARIGHCYESIFLLWPKGRSMPVAHEYLPDCIHVPHDENSGPASEHPCAKPVALFEKLIRAATHEGALVVDPFAGSGAAVEAALRLNRRVIAAELVPEIFAIAQRRITRCRVELADSASQHGVSVETPLS